tara:strand:- start:303 stop:440 length:138 start_codon:yes stop_codon:yes gene_type:complete
MRPCFVCYIIAPQTKLFDPVSNGRLSAESLGYEPLNLVGLVILGC